MEAKVETALPKESEKESRRDFLKKAGKVALYAPPAFVLLMQPSREALACKSLGLQSGTRPKPRQNFNRARKHRNIIGRISALFQ